MCKLLTTTTALIAMAIPALGATITTSTPFDVQGGGSYNDDFQVLVTPFNQSLGRLLSTSVTVAGELLPGQEWQEALPTIPPSSVPVTLTGRVGFEYDQEALAAEQLIAVQNGSTYTAIGTPEAFSVTETGNPFGDVDVFAWTPPVRLPLLTGLADLTHVVGAVAVTYTYAPADPRGVPEPAGWTLLLAGMVGLACVARVRV